MTGPPSQKYYTHQILKTKGLDLKSCLYIWLIYWVLDRISNGPLYLEMDFKKLCKLQNKSRNMVKLLSVINFFKFKN